MWLVFGLSACHQSNQLNSNNNTPNSKQIDQLITKGEHLENANADSLPVVVKKLQQAAGNTGTDKTALVYAKVFQAHYLWMRSDHKSAMSVAVDALSDAEKWKVNRAIPELYGMMANLYKENTDYKMAFAAAEKGLNAAVSNKDTAEIIALLGLKAMFTHSVWLTSDKHITDKSLELQLEALAMAEADQKYERMRVRFYDNIAQYYKDNKHFDKAIEYGNRAVPLAYKYNQPRSLTYAYSWLGEAWFYKGDQTKGLAYLDSALQISKKIKEPYRQMEIYMHLYDLAMSSADYKKAIEYSTKSRILHDSLQVQSNVKQIGELQIKYETAKKDEKIALLDKAAKIKNREMIYIIVGSLIFIAFCLLLLFQSRVIHRHNLIIKAKNSELNEALNDIAYIQSHELRKPVASILGLMNVIKGDDYQADKDTLLQLEAAAKDLDAKIKAINAHAQI
jgi:tetratricopeptide (TPR) repeat protein